MLTNQANTSMNKLITGNTRLLGIIGDPVKQARAPEVSTSLFRLNGIDAVCVPMHVSPPDFLSFIDGMSTMRNLMGLIITVPHKPAAASLVHQLADRARAVGAANVLDCDDLAPTGSGSGSGSGSA